MCSGTTSCGSSTSPSGNSGKRSRVSPMVCEGYAVGASSAWGTCRVSLTMTALLWLTRDLRLHDHPAQWAALDDHERVVPVFCLDDRLLHGRHASGPRTQ